MAKSAKELVDELEKDPEYQAAMAERNRQLAEMEAMLDRDEKPLIEALEAAGWPPRVRQCGQTRSVWDFVNTIEPYPHLLNTLAEHLPRPYHPRTKEGRDYPF